MMVRNTRALLVASMLALTGCRMPSAYTSTLSCVDAGGNETYRVTGEGRWIPYKTDSLYNTYTMNIYQKRRDESCFVNVTSK
jgi:hypothetical protein